MIGGLDETYISLGGVLRGGGVRLLTKIQYSIGKFSKFGY